MKNLKLIFFDDFDGNVLDRSKWNIITEGNPANNEEQYYLPKNVEVRDSKLFLIAKKETYKHKKYTSGRVDTQGLFSLKYGRVEVKAKVPAGIGTWPAAWMLGDSIKKVGWPKCGEIDIMEHVGYNPNFSNFWLHTGLLNHTVNKQRGGRIYVENNLEKFHIYSVEWTNEYLDIYIDQIRVFSLLKRNSDTNDEWPFDQSFFIILNLAIGGTWGESKGIDDESFPQTFEIDYVKAYEFVEIPNKIIDLDQKREFL